MQREVFTSRVSKTGMIFLAAYENKSLSLVSKRDLESTLRTCKAQHDPLVEQQFHSIYLTFSVIVTTYPLFLFKSYTLFFIRIKSIRILRLKIAKI